MTSRNVAIRRDIYDALDKERRAGESFSRLFERFLHEKGPLEEVYGSWGPPDASHDRRVLAHLRGVGAPPRRR